MGPRRYSISAIRSIFLVQGVLYHSLLPYAGQSWRVSAGIVVPWASAASAWLHSFRMQGFFFIAGILAVRGFRQFGAWRFSKERARRILIPLAFVWMLVNRVEAKLVWGRFDGGIPPVEHLWFLQDLIVFTVLLVIGAHVLRRAPHLGAVVFSVARRFNSLGRVTLLAMAGLAVMNVSGGQALGAAWTRAIPGTGIILSELLFYGMFFFGGAVVKWQSQVDRLEQPPRWTHYLIAIGLWPVVRWTDGLTFHGQWTLSLMFGAAYAWCMIRLYFGLAPMALRRLDEKSVGGFADSGYTVYLLHFCLVAATAVQLQSLDLPSGLEIAMLCTVGFGIPYLFHQYVVRRVPIVATLLNGAPFPPLRHAFRAAAEPSPGAGAAGTAPVPSR